MGDRRQGREPGRIRKRSAGLPEGRVGELGLRGRTREGDWKSSAGNGGVVVEFEDAAGRGGPVRVTVEVPCPVGFLEFQTGFLSCLYIYIYIYI